VGAAAVVYLTPLGTAPWEGKTYSTALKEPRTGFNPTNGVPLAIALLVRGSQTTRDLQFLTSAYSGCAGNSTAPPPLF